MLDNQASQRVPSASQGVWRNACALSALLLAIAALAPPALAGTSDSWPDFGLSWNTIADPGNRDTNKQESDLSIPIGGVDYTYRMTTTEVTVSQWFEFVQAYLPYYEGTNFSDPAFGGSHILFGVSGGQVVGAAIENPFWNDTPADMSWEYAARYVNWLHNGKASGQWAFESGAYDTSTFVKDGNGNWLHQAERSPGATFWIPSLDEWTKAAYWDPEKDGGKGGYWQYPHQKDVPPIPGLPEEGGETNYGPIKGLPYDVGSYPDTMSPWGLLDMSGGRSEHIELLGFAPNWRGVKGSFHPGMVGFGDDPIDDLAYSIAFSGGFNGLRVASAIPAPGPATLAIASLSFVLTRRRRSRSSAPPIVAC